MIMRKLHAPPQFTKDATERDIKQLVAALALVLPLLAVAVIGAAGLVGGATALRIGFWLAAFVALAFGLVVALCIVGSYVYEYVERRLWSDEER